MMRTSCARATARPPPPRRRRHLAHLPPSAQVPAVAGAASYCVYRRNRHFRLLLDAITVKDYSELKAAGKLPKRLRVFRSKKEEDRYQQFGEILAHLADTGGAAPDDFSRAALLDFLTPDARFRAAVRERHRTRERFAVQDDDANARLFFSSARVAKLLATDAAKDTELDGGLAYYDIDRLNDAAAKKMAGPRITFDEKKKMETPEQFAARMRDWLACA